MSTLESLKLNTLTIFYLPEYIEQALHRNKFNIVDIADYSKLRQVLSIEDMAVLNSIVSVVDKDSRLTSNVNAVYHSKFIFNNSESEQEFKRSVVTLSETEEITKSIKTYLTNTPQVSNSEQYQSDKLPYRFIVLIDKIVVVLSEGFLSYIEQPKNRLDYLRGCLKTLYSKLSIQDVSYSNIYEEYLVQLKNVSS